MWQTPWQDPCDEGYTRVFTPFQAPEPARGKVRTMWLQACAGDRWVISIQRGTQHRAHEWSSTTAGQLQPTH